jgi:hypothetical protein
MSAVNGHAGKKANADFIVSTSPVWNATPRRIINDAHCAHRACLPDRSLQYGSAPPENTARSELALKQDPHWIGHATRIRLAAGHLAV